MSQSGHGIRLPSGKQVRPRVVTAIQKQLDKYDKALKLATEIEKKVDEIRDSDAPPPDEEK